MGDIFICIAESDLAYALSSQIEGKQTLIAVGNSSQTITDRLADHAGCLVVRQAVETLTFTKVRAQRELVAQVLSITGQATLVDDVAVSGRTLSVAAGAVEPSPTRVAVGMLLETPSIVGIFMGAGINRIAAGIRYRSEKSGIVPPLNTLSTLLENPERIIALNASSFYNQKWRTVQFALRELQEATR